MKYTVVVNEGPLSADDNATYWCDEEPTFAGSEVPIYDTDGALADESIVKFVIFTPRNGRSPGQQTRVPLDRLVSISERE